MKIQSIRFIKQFVLFTNVIRLDDDGKLITEQEQHHVTFGELHRVATFEKRSDNSVFIEFDESNNVKGTATVDTAYVEKIGGGQTLTNNCCDKGN